MTTTLSSKIFEAADYTDSAALCEAFAQWVSSLGDLTGKRVEVCIAPTKRRYARKAAAVKQLGALVGDNLGIEEKPDVWERDGYRFCFKTRKYYWNNREIHLTASQGLFLYRWLVLDDGTSQRYHLWNMRTRLGKGFLAELGRYKRPTARTLADRNNQIAAIAA
jgi:hypothetical protein